MAPSKAVAELKASNGCAETAPTLMQGSFFGWSGETHVSSIKAFGDEIDATTKPFGT